MQCTRAHGSPLGFGSIRTELADFQVTELYDFEPTGTGEHLLLWIRKSGANTGWVANQIANHFGLRHFDVSYCGKKDRHAVTEQWFSCWLPTSEPDLSTLNIEGVELVRQVRHQRKLRRGEHTGNRFKLRIRDLKLNDKAELETRLEKILEVGYPNYFGQQRFGINQQNLCKAIELIDDESLQSRRKLDRKQKDIYLSTLRSWMFNSQLNNDVIANDWASDDMLWVYGLSPHRDIELPEVEPEFAKAAAFIEKMDIKAHARPKRIMPRQLAWQVGEECLELAFDLPVGAYATTLLEELLEIEDAHR
jgi:tRNA pseudouridine13 synthase